MEDQEKILLANNTYLMLMIDFKIDKFNPETKVYEYAKEPDFEGVYQIFRQRGNHNVSTESFNDWLHKLLKERVDDYKNGNKIESYDLELLETVKLFLKWLKTRKDVYSSPFSRQMLQEMYDTHDNDIWPHIEFDEFKDSFEGKGNKINLEQDGSKKRFNKMLADCYTKYNTKELMTYKPIKFPIGGIKEWVKKTFGVTYEKRK